MVKEGLEALDTIIRNGYINPNVKELGIIKQELETSWERDIENIVYNVYYDLCSKFIKYCREKPKTPFDEIPEAKAISDEIVVYKSFVKRYFQIDFDKR